jgi:hypothetical protein
MLKKETYMKEKLKLIYLFVMLCCVLGTVSMRAEVKLEQYLKIELKRLQEMYRLLDRFAGERKQRHMPPAAAIAERLEACLEGTATYANVKMAMLIKDAEYKAGMSRQGK